MVFSSLIFIFFFLPIFLLVYYVSPKKIKNFVLMIFSLIFYAWGETKYIFLLVLVSLINFICALLINRRRKKGKKEKIILILTVIFNIGILGCFKYLGFITDNLNNIGFNLSIPDLALPLGISFFVFQGMSYVIDVYRKDIKVEKNFIDFMTYISMFPQLIAGPIVRYIDIAKELKERTINFEKFSDGLFIFLTGLFKKVIIANNIGYLFSLISNDLSSISMASVWLGILAFALQIYFDFSGYSTMAIGLGKMIGFNYPDNFNYPYMAKSITDFWRRWHMTLSGWFRDYVYIPLGGNKKGLKRQAINIFIVWMLTGLWHGASWNYVLWGIYFAIILIIEKIFLNKYLQKLPNVFKHLYAILLILIGWMLFAFEDFGDLKLYLMKAFVNGNIIDNSFIFYVKNYFIFIVLGIVFSTPIFSNIKYNKVNSVIIFIVYIALFIYTIACLVSDSYNPFLYFRF